MTTIWFPSNPDIARQMLFLSVFAGFACLPGITTDHPLTNKEPIPPPYVYILNRVCLGSSGKREELWWFGRGHSLMGRTPIERRQPSCTGPQRSLFDCTTGDSQ